MNRENLLKMADYVATLDQEMFDMGSFLVKHGRGCGTIGCIIGHCKEFFDKKFDRELNYNLIGDHLAWSVTFTDLNSDSNEWDYLFSGKWFFVDNTPLGASKRIKHFLEHGLPADWSEQMENECKLSY